MRLAQNKYTNFQLAKSDEGERLKENFAKILIFQIHDDIMKTRKSNERVI